MKFLQIAEGTYINAERIDGVSAYCNGELKVFVGGSDGAWTVKKSYANDVMAFVQGKGAEK